jgi:hypothetical protein
VARADVALANEAEAAGRAGAARRRRHAARRPWARAMQSPASTSPPPAGARLGEVLSEREGEQLGRSLAAHASIFRWQRGDVLLTRLFAPGPRLFIFTVLAPAPQRVFVKRIRFLFKRTAIFEHNAGDQNYFCHLGSGVKNV